MDAGRRDDLLRIAQVDVEARQREPLVVARLGADHAETARRSFSCTQPNVAASSGLPGPRQRLVVRELALARVEVAGGAEREERMHGIAARPARPRGVDVGVDARHVGGVEDRNQIDDLVHRGSAQLDYAPNWRR